MPIERANYEFQPGLFEIEEYELADGEGKPISPEEAQWRSDQARRALEARINTKHPDYAADKRRSAQDEMGEEEPRPAAGEEAGVGWFDEYSRLVEGGWKWRVAAYIAWAASPRVGRWPSTQEKLATEVLGLTSDRQIIKWRKDNPRIMDLISDLQVAPMLSHRADVIGALVKSAMTPDYKNHQDRELFLIMTGDYIPISRLVAHLRNKMPDGADGMNDEELLKYSGFEPKKRGVIQVPAEMADEIRAEDGPPPPPSPALPPFLENETGEGGRE